MSSIELVGITVDHEYGYGGYTGRSEIKEEVVATFDTKEQAEAYERASRLKNPKPHQKYRNSSLLIGCSSAEIRVHTPPYEPPHNPELPK